MKLIDMMKMKVTKLSLAGASLAGLFATGNAFADSSGGFTMSGLESNISSTSGDIVNIIMIVAVLVGLMFMFIGLAQIRAHFHGSPQEKHLGKGIASMVFATCIFMVIPITHALVNSFSAGTSAGFSVGSAINMDPTIGTAGYSS